MGQFLALVGFFVALAGLISLVKPLSFLRIRSRGVGLLVLILGFAVMGVGASISGTTTESARTRPRPRIASETRRGGNELVVVDSRPVSESYARYVVGTVKNNSSRSYGYVQVEINLYDSGGNQVGSTLDNTNNLEAGGTWKFKALILDDRATSYKVIKVTGF